MKSKKTIVETTAVIIVILIAFGVRLCISHQEHVPTTLPLLDSETIERLDSIEHAKERKAAKRAERRQKRDSLRASKKTATPVSRDFLDEPVPDSFD